MDTDGKLLKQYPWAAYSNLPPVMREGIEVMPLKDIFVDANASQTAQTGTAIEYCQKLLREDKTFRAPFLTSWKLGSFDAIRESEAIQSFRGSTPGPKPAVHGTVPQTLTGSSSQEGCIQSTGLQATTGGDNSLTIYGGTFNEVAGDNWTINYSVDHQRETLEWLSSVDYQLTHNDVAKKRAEKTGEWFVASEEYASWCSSADTRVLWCPGIPGVGKTVLASSAINHLHARANLREAVVFIYFNYTMQKQQNLNTLLGALSRQMYRNGTDSGVASVYDDLYKTHKTRKTHASVEELQSALSKSFQSYDTTFIVLDALDEYLEQYSDAKIQAILDLLLSLNTGVKLLVTSRILGEMEKIFKDLGAIKREIHAFDSDVDSYLLGRIKAQEFCFTLTPTLTETIVKEVKTAAKGRFLMAELHMSSLVEHSSPGDVKDALKALPDGVDQTYAYVMDRIRRHSERRRELAMFALMWIACAVRPLSVKELQHALATKAGKSNIDDYVTEASVITAACAGLVVIQHEQNTISFVHYTTQEYFERHRHECFPSAYSAIVRTCLNYLSRSCFFGIPNDKSLWVPATTHSLIQDLRQSHAFYDYAALHWGSHAQKQLSTGDEAEALQGEILSFLQANHPGTKLSFRYVLCQNMGAWLDGPGEEGSGVFLAVYHRQIHALTALLDKVTTIPLTIQRMTPLIVAARLGRVDAITLILEREAHPFQVKDSETQAIRSLSSLAPLNDINAFDRSNRTAVSWAAAEGHVASLELLLKHPGVDVNISDNEGNSALLLAIKYSVSETIVQTLIDYEGTDVNRQDNDGMSPLSYAASFGADSVVKRLLGHKDVDLNLPCKKGRSALCWACIVGKTSIVELLLGMDGTDVNAKDDSGRGPLSWASELGHAEVVELLLRNSDIKVNSQDEEGRTAFSWAAGGGHIAIMKHLIAHDGVDINLQDASGFSPIYKAGIRGHTLAFQLLLEQPNIEVDHPKVFTLVAKYNRGTAAIAPMLQLKGLDLNVADEEGYTALSYAVMESDRPAVEALLQRKDVDINHLDNNGRPPVYGVVRRYSTGLASEAEAAAIVELFLKRDDFDPTIQDKEGKTLMFYAARHEHIPSLTLLAQRAREMDSRKRKLDSDEEVAQETSKKERRLDSPEP